MFYLIDINHSPAVVVLAKREQKELEDVAQRYADQVGRPLVEATGPGPDGGPKWSPLDPAPVLRVWSPTIHPAPVVTPAGVSGVNVAPPDHHAGLEGDLSKVWDLLKKLEKPALQVLVQMLQALAG